MPVPWSRPGLCPIEIDAGLAFGSGEHATTRSCLAAIDRLARQRRFVRVLDVGCGSGVLAIAAAKCWPAAVLAVDNDPIAVRVARDNAELNGVGERVRAELAEGYGHPFVRRRRPYDLILANILADPLIELAPALRRTSGAGRPGRPVRAARPPGRGGGCGASAPGPAAARPCSAGPLDGAGAGPICSGSPARLKPVPRRRCCAGHPLWL